MAWYCIVTNNLQKFHFARTSDCCNRSHNVSLPIILKKTKVGQILQFSCISLLLVPILLYWIQVSVSLNVLLYFGAEMATFCIKHIENRKYFFNIVPPRAPTIPFAGECVIIFYIIYVNGVLGPGGGGQYHTAINVARKPEPKYETRYNFLLRKQNSKK